MLSRALHDDVSELGLTWSEVHLLTHLADGRERGPSELAALAGLRTTTTTGVLDRMEDHGLVRRGPHATDRRAVVVTLTPEGVRAAALVTGAAAALEDRAAAALPPGAVAVLSSHLDTLAGEAP